MKKKTGTQIIKPDNKVISGDLTSDIRRLIETARHNVAVTVNAGLTILYWQIGSRIRQDILKEKRARYGEEILPTLSAKLVPEFGSGFSVRNLSRMIRFAEVFPEGEIVVTLSRQLSWSHFVGILPIKDDLQRDFYAEMCRMERWNICTLISKIQGILFERTTISKKPEELDKFVSIHKPDASHISQIGDFFKAYITDSAIRDIIENKEYNRLATNPKVTIADLKDLEEWRDVIPEYVKDYVSLNAFM